MKEQILSFASEIAPSGFERALQEKLLESVKDVADAVRVDTLGNGIAEKKGNGPHIMLAAHADESGVMVIDIDELGFLRLIAIGNLGAHEVINQVVTFTNGVTGVIEKEDHVKLADVTYNDLFVDIGASSGDEARERVYVGIGGVVGASVVALSETIVAGRALDNRVGCVVALEAFRALAQENRHVTLVFTAQNEVGARGAKTAAYQVQPDLAIIIDAAPASDTPGNKQTALKLGKGPAVKIMDGSAIVPLDVKNAFIETAKNIGLDVQYEVWPKGKTDAGAVQLSVEGIRIGGVSYPARFAGAVNTVVDLRDVEAAKRLVVETAKTFRV